MMVACSTRSETTVTDWVELDLRKRDGACGALVVPGQLRLVGALQGLRELEHDQAACIGMAADAPNDRQDLRISRPGRRMAMAEHALALSHQGGEAARRGAADAGQRCEM